MEGEEDGRKEARNGQDRTGTKGWKRDEREKGRVGMEKRRKPSKQGRKEGR
jgi:hypothetical protein